MKLLEIFDFVQYRLTKTLVKGVVVEQMSMITTFKGMHQPVDLTEFSEVATESTHFEKNANRITSYKKLYSQTSLALDDIITLLPSNDKFIILKCYDYMNYGLTGDHYKYVMGMIEA